MIKNIYVGFMKYKITEERKEKPVLWTYETMLKKTKEEFKNNNHGKTNKK